MGLLTLNGTIDLAQFWPDGESDADTVKVNLAAQNPFVFKSNPNGAGKPTSVFIGAVVHGKVRKQAIDKKNRVVIRLQGIDAPELHYPGVGSPKFRQHLAEGATLALHDFLKKLGPNPLRCKVTTNVQKPKEVFDTYGRFIGDIHVIVGGKSINVNQWLISEGWVFPSFYNSMTDAEINTLLALSEQARLQGRKNLWARGRYAANLGQLDQALTYNRKGPPDTNDKGPVIFAKFYRRLYQFDADRASGKTTTASLKAYLDEPAPSKRDKFHLTNEFLDQGATAAPIYDLGESINPNNRLRHQPKDFVFKEGTSKIFDANGREIIAWQ